MPQRLTPDLPPEVPCRGSSVIQWLGRVLLRISGWKLIGEVPRIPKLVIAVGPHTSNWDLVFALYVLMASGIRLSWFMKREAFIWPFSRLFIAFGGIPLDRSAASGTVVQIAEAFSKRERLWVALTPEGTRRKVSYWKTGFLRMAAAAEVPVLLVGWDYPTRTIIIDKLWRLTGDHERDAATIRDYMNRHFTGRHPHQQ